MLCGDVNSLLATFLLKMLIPGDESRAVQAVLTAPMLLRAVTTGSRQGHPDQTTQQWVMLCFWWRYEITWRVEWRTENVKDFILSKMRSYATLKRP